ncbi:hypothetical protein LS71_002370 [Helicobacter jaachi]|uniref:DUF481 domain-containing protein n=2 Tax=Helicobacter jaachi TaxID=1677920 RepID=A0A4U8TGK1_9HELI|nr:hypothetical protein LS71_002370 [Helicobacter jaachi]
MSEGIKKCLIVMCCAVGVYGAPVGIDINPDKRGWNAELKRVAINLSSTSVEGQTAYASFSDSRISGDSQLIGQGYFDMGLDFYSARFVFFNSALAEYGRTTLVRGNERISNTTIDRILLSTDYTHRIWYVPTLVGGFEVGPFIRANYQTGFENRRQITRLNMGMKLFDGIYVKDLHLNAFTEKDFGLQRSAENYGWEGGIRFEYAFSPDSKLYYYTNFRHYLHSTADDLYNPLYQLEFEVRVDTKLYKKLSLAPFIKYYALQGRHIDQLGSNVFVGFSLSFGYVFLDATKKQELEPLQNL